MDLQLAGEKNDLCSPGSRKETGGGFKILKENTNNKPRKNELDILFYYFCKKRVLKNSCVIGQRRNEQKPIPTRTFE